MRFEVHVYSVDGPSTWAYNSRAFAKKKAREFFRQSNVYKVKVWDLSKGQPVPNMVNAPGLIMQLV